MELLAHPFRLNKAGHAVTVTQDTDAAVEQQLAVIVQTRKRERALEPDFGITDPTFDVLDRAEVNAVLAEYGPEVRVRSLSRRALSERRVAVELVWVPEGRGDDDDFAD